jgi:hypothetical protein
VVELELIMTDYNEAGVIASVRIDGLCRGPERSDIANDFMRQLQEAFDSEINTLRIEDVSIEEVVDTNDLRADEPQPRDEPRR